MVIVDIAILLLVVVFTTLGFYWGAIRQLLAITGLLASFVVAGRYGVSVAALIVVGHGRISTSNMDGCTADVECGQWDCLRLWWGSAYVYSRSTAECITDCDFSVILWQRLFTNGAVFASMNRVVR